MPDGQIVTFYSFKGGTGRTMALANVAWILAANGQRVLVADWDLESPGLHRFYMPFLHTDPVQERGVIDMVRAYEWAVAKAVEKAQADAKTDTRPELDDLRTLAASRAQVQHYAFDLHWEFPGGGHLSFLSAGQQNSEYTATLSGLDWDNFYDRLGGGEFFDALRTNMKKHYDYVLIDSRTGLSDVADICTVHLPDVLVDCFTLSTQGIEGGAHVARDIQSKYENRKIRILPVPMRVDLAEKERAEAGVAFARRQFAGLPAGMSDEQRRAYWTEVEVPYRPFYAYEETLAVFGDDPGSPATLLASFERLTGQITDGEITSLPMMDQAERREVRARFTRRVSRESPQAIIRHAPEDQAWVEWIKRTLQGAGVQFLDEDLGTSFGRRAEAAPHIIQVVSGQESGHPPDDAHTQDLPYYAVYVADVRALPRFSDAAAEVFLAGLSAREAVDRLLEMLDLTMHSPPEGTSYPGSEPKIFRAPARNARFTGREEDLAKLRATLRETGTAVVLPVALQGLGGVGKTQVALEYVHRFKADYDLIWWIDAAQPSLLNGFYSDLGDLIENHYGPIAPAGATASEKAQLVVQALSNNRPVDRWLCILDNAEDISVVEGFIPTGRGHKIITSRNRAWDEHATSMSLDVFTRAESVSHLRERVPSMVEQEANQVADVLGDLPLAVATAGAWLAETGTRVQDYLSELEQRGLETLSLGQLDNYPAPVARAWDLSLRRLKEQSPGAARLFDLCAMLAPVIHLDLLYGRKMAEVLEPYEPDVAEPMVIGRLIKEINRLALIKLDTGARQVHVHRLVQAVVRARMTPDEAASARHDIQQVLAATRPAREVDDPESWPGYRMIWPHLSSSDAMTSPDEAVRRLVTDRVRYLWQRGDLRGGRALGDRAEDAWQQMMDADPDSRSTARLHRQLLRLRFNMSNILRDLAHFEESRRLDEKVLEEQRELLGPEHPHTLMTAGGLSASLRALGQYGRALAIDRETHATWSRHFDEDNPRTLAAANNLAVSYRVNGDFKEARRLDDDTYRRRRHTLGPEHPLTMHSATAVGRDLLEAGRYQEAGARIHAAMEAAHRVLGAEHRTTLNARSLYGVALRSVGREAEARNHFTEAIVGLSRRFGMDSPDALGARLSNASNMLALDELQAGNVEIRKVHNVYQRRLGDTHPYTLVCQINLASAMRLQGDRDAALAMIRPVADNLEKQLGDKHPYVLAGLMVLGVLLGDAGEMSQARDLEEVVVQRMTAGLGAKHPDTLRCLANALVTRAELGDSKAVQERPKVINDLAEIVGEDHPHIGTLRAERKLLRAIDPQPV